MKNNSEEIIKAVNAKVLARQFLTILKKRGVSFLIIYIIRAFNDGYIKKYLWGSFSQKGEDLVIEKIIGDKKKGFYVDIGAHNPNIFNNTKRFYMKGWNGINVEPNPILIKAFIRERKRDINLNVGVMRTSGKAIYYEFEADGLSTFSKEEMKNNLKLGYKLKQELKISVLSLKEIINKYAKYKIDFISIDTEGLDFEVLQSNDWKKYRPTVICIETSEFNFMVTGKKEQNKKRLIDDFMKKNGYKTYNDNGLNTIYLKID